MAESKNLEAEVVHNLPDDLAAGIGRVMAVYTRIEHNLSSIASLLLQLNKAEMRIALRMPRAVDRLELVLDLFAIKAITVDIDAAQLNTEIAHVAARRDWLAHGLWLKHPENGKIYLRLTRGKWDANSAAGIPINRPIYPQSIEFSAADCMALVEKCEAVLEKIDELGRNLDFALSTWPERFRQPAPLVNPLGHRKPIGQKSKPQTPPQPSRG